MPSKLPYSFAAFAHALRTDTLPVDGQWRALFFTLAAGERSDLNALAAECHVRVTDTIAAQLQELARTRYPSPSKLAERDAFVAQVTRDAGGADAYGRWAFFAWSRTIVHLLPEDDYFAVITSRNHDKITLDEQAALRTKRVAVIGLSVGGEAAVNIAQEHLCGELVIADFDELDLSNLNRLQAGIDELGENKAHIVARRIARLNPYLPVRVFAEGVRSDNIGEFLNGVDLLVEECDGLTIKYQIREEAKRRGINIIFGADERGFLSIEPHGDDPSFPIFHGRITAPPKPRAEHPDALSFFKALAEWIGGWESISQRSRDSLLAVDDRLCGYPQLASEARFNAGVLGHAARVTLLGAKIAGGVMYIDLDEMVGRVSSAG